MDKIEKIRRKTSKIIMIIETLLLVVTILNDIIKRNQRKKLLPF